MGCFNLLCGVTSLPIVMGNPIVGIPLRFVRREDFMHDTGYSPCDFPVHGVYDDYGRVENSEQELDSQSGDGAMFMHLAAYEQITKHGDGFIASFKRDLLNSFDGITESDDPDIALISTYTFNKSVRRLFISADRVLVDDWKDRFFENPELLERFLKELSPVINMPVVYGYRVLPAAYGGQDVSVQKLLDMQAIRQNLLDNNYPGYDDDSG